MLTAPYLGQAASKTMHLKSNQSYMTASHGAIYVIKVDKGVVTFKPQLKASEGCSPPEDVPSQTLPQEKLKNPHHILAVIDCERDRQERAGWANQN